MLKFQPNYTTSLSDFEEFFIAVYVFVDALYQQYVPDSVSTRGNANHAKTTDSEISTISLCGEIAGIDSQNAWYAFVKKNYGFLFPNLCSRTRFHRRHKALPDLAENQGMLVILGDKGYVSRSLKETLANEGITLLALPRSNSKEPFPSSIRKMIVKQRRKIETVFSQLNDQFHMEHVLAKSFYGLCSRLVTKIFGYNLCLLLNSMFSATSEISKIKQLIY